MLENNFPSFSEKELEEIAEEILRESGGDSYLDPPFIELELPPVSSADPENEFSFVKAKKPRNHKLEALKDRFEVLKDSYTDDDSSVLETMAQKIIVPVLKLDLDEGCRMWEYLLKHYYNRIPPFRYHIITDGLIEHADYDVLVNVFSNHSKCATISNYVFSRDPYNNHLYCDHFIHQLILNNENYIARRLILRLLRNNTPGNDPQNNLYDLLHIILTSLESRWQMSSEGLNFVSEWIAKITSETKRAELEVLLMDLVDVVENGAPKGDIPFSILASEGGIELFMEESRKHNKSASNSSANDETEEYKQEKSTPEMVPDDVWNWYCAEKTETRLSHAFATASNKFWWDQDNDEYDYDDGASQTTKTSRTNGSWYDVMCRLEKEIMRIMSNEVSEITNKDWRQIQIAFMGRNGYHNGNGWWMCISNHKMEQESH